MYNCICDCLRFKYYVSISHDSNFDLPFNENIPFEDLQLGEVIGIGSFAEVKKALVCLWFVTLSVWNGIDVAVKILKVRNDDKVQREVEAQRTMKHVNLLHIYGMSQVNNCPVLVLDLGDCSLDRVLSNYNHLSYSRMFCDD